MAQLSRAALKLYFETGDIPTDVQFADLIDSFQNFSDDGAGEANTVDSVNSQTGVVVLDADDISDAATTKKFTNATEQAKLAGIETGATADQTGAEIKAAYEAELNTNAYTDAEKSKLTGIAAGAEVNLVDSVNSLQGAVVLDADDISDAATVNKFTTAAEISKLAGIETGATADQTGAEIKTAYEAEANTNAFTDAEKTKLTGIETGATADQTGAEIKAAYEAQANTNAYTDAEVSKLAAIEAGADVTDAANVETAIEGITFTAVSGATGDEVMIIDATDGGLKAVLWENLPGAGAGISNVVEDTTPQLGGALDGQGNEIANYVNSVVTSVTGTLTTAAHAGNIIVTSGNVTIPTTAGFSVTIVAGGAHTVTFNGTTSAAMAAGDVMTAFVESGTVIHAVLTAAADKVSFT